MESAAGGHSLSGAPMPKRFAESCITSAKHQKYKRAIRTEKFSLLAEQKLGRHYADTLIAAGTVFSSKATAKLLYLTLTA